MLWDTTFYGQMEILSVKACISWTFFFFFFFFLKKKELQEVLWAGSRAALLKITVSGIRNRLINTVWLYSIYTIYICAREPHTQLGGSLMETHDVHNVTAVLNGLSNFSLLLGIWSLPQLRVPACLNPVLTLCTSAKRAQTILELWKRVATSPHFVRAAEFPSHRPKYKGWC